MVIELFGLQGYVPHGHCYLWQLPLVTLHGVSDALTAIAYFSIPLTLLHFIRQRKDNPFRSALLLFSLFILACGVCHVFDIWTLWFPHYRLAGVIKAITALVSCVTAVKLWTWTPQFLALPSPEALERANQQLSDEIEQRRKSQQILQQVVKGTATATGEAFFNALAQNLASALSIKYVMLTEVVCPNSLTITILAQWPETGGCKTGVCEATGTPCEQVLKTGQPQQYLENVQAFFPKADGLRITNAQSYVGVPLIDLDKQIVGVLCVYHDEPIVDGDLAEAIMSLFAEKATAELQRQRIDAMLQRANNELEQRVRDRTTDLAVANWHLRRLAVRARTTAKIVQRIRRSLDLKQIFATTTAELRHALDCDRVLVYRFNSDWSSYIVAETVSDRWSACCPQRRDIPKADWINSAVNDERCTVRLYDDGDNHVHKPLLPNIRNGIYRQDIDYFSVSDVSTADVSESHLKLLPSLQAHACVTVPIYVGEELWGLLACYQNDGPHEWDSEDIQMAVQIGGQLGVAIQQSELLNHSLEQAKELQRAKEVADASNSAKSDFLAHMSHELRTPLNAILGFTQLLERDSGLSSRHQHYIHIINSSGEHLLNLINNVLEMSKIEAGHLQRYDSDFELNALLSEIQAVLGLKAQQKGLKFFFERFPNLPGWIRTDQSKLRQILFNLLGNAIKFTETGHVCLRVGLAAAETSVCAAEPPCCVLKIEVEDSGPGIEPSELSRLFEAFHQTRTGLKSAQGTGLGLPISRQYAQLMRGNLSVESTPGQGTRFTLILPIEVKSPPTLEDDDDLICGCQMHAPDAESVRVLVAEDNALNRLLLREYLTPWGYEIREVEDGEAAIAVWQQWHPHLILMDMRMPKLNGQQATQRIRQIEATSDKESTIILALTAMAVEDRRQELLALGCNDVIYKPVRPEDLMATLQQYGVGSWPLSSDPLQQLQLQHSLDLAPQHLDCMSSQWIQSLHRAACQCNDSQVKALLREMPPSQSDVAQVITNFAVVYEFDRILDLTTPLIADTAVLAGDL